MLDKYINISNIRDQQESLIEDYEMRQKIFTIMVDGEKSDKKKANLIFQERQKAPKIFSRAIINISYSFNSTLVVAHGLVQSFLSLAIERNLFSTTKLLFALFKSHITEEKAFLLNSIQESLDVQEITEKKLKLELIENAISDVINYNLYGTKPLLFVAISKDFTGNIIKLLLKEGANVNLLRHNPLFEQLATNNVTALGEAINLKNDKAFQLLISHQTINLHQSLKFLYWEDARNCGPLVKKLLRRLDNIISFDENGFTLLHVIFDKYGYIGVFGNLISENSEFINIRTIDGNSLLHIAVSLEKNIQDVGYLVRLGIDVNIQNNQGNTALHNLFSPLQNLDLQQKIKIEYIARYLLENGAKLDIKNRLGYSLSQSPTQELKIIIKSFEVCCEIKNIITDHYRTEHDKIASIYRIYFENFRIFCDILLLLNKRQSECFFTKNLLEFLDLSISDGLIELTKFFLYAPYMLLESEQLEESFLNLRKQTIISYIKPDHSCFIDLAAEKDKTGRITKLLIDYGFDINSGEYKPTALEIAMKYNNLKSAEAIISHNFFNLRFHLTRFFLKKSLTCTEKDFFLILVDKIEDLEATDEIGETMLHKVARFCQSHYSMTILTKKFLKKNLSLDLKTFKDGLTPLHIALAEGSVEAVRTLLKFAAPADSQTHRGFTLLEHMLYENLSDLKNSVTYSDETVRYRLKKIFFKEKIKLLYKFHDKVLINKYSQELFANDKNNEIFWRKISPIVNQIGAELRQEIEMENKILRSANAPSRPSLTQRPPKKSKTLSLY